eukprot:snap_masked-scaffold_10-processed-gene-13.39-mRNA-1 protein AED:1.00 eAED:1.00 QI:0/-1/0/0/-1/1/1/0/69
MGVPECNNRQKSRKFSLIMNNLYVLAQIIVVLIIAMINDQFGSFKHKLIAVNSLREIVKSTMVGNHLIL